MSSKPYKIYPITNLRKCLTLNYFIDLEADSTPKVNLVVNNHSVSQLGLAPAKDGTVDTATDYSDSETEVTSERASDAEPNVTTTPRRTARIRLTDKQSGQLHKRARLA